MKANHNESVSRNEQLNVQHRSAQFRIENIVEVKQSEQTQFSVFALYIPIHTEYPKRVDCDVTISLSFIKYTTQPCVSMGSKLLLVAHICVFTFCVLSKPSLAVEPSGSNSRREVNCTAFYIEKELGLNTNPTTVSVQCLLSPQIFVFFWHFFLCLVW